MKNTTPNNLDSPELSTVENSKLLALKAQDKILNYRGGVIDSSDVSNILNVKTQIVDEKRKNKELIAVKVNNKYKYPAWQFDNTKIIPDLKNTLIKLLIGNDEWMTLRFFVGENDYLKANLPNHACVIDALKANEFEAVQNAVKAYFTSNTI